MENYNNDIKDNDYIFIVIILFYCYILFLKIKNNIKNLKIIVDNYKIIW